ncbi:ArsR/SmtB family transcription factor [Serinibacter salmoneus]|uniref:ArsR family transcriptional regulator n=1 Tax=Serinibacter salmoneus TaxID=556530 RepID=A0A2A9D5V1_9MICO|nr:metalloregulator ArsR/SmtB family transcription factor [Serinibacter salmoneus]PFG21220.1 ArsR family transcriptional regulator [Serinibacter salmoneus]
MTTVPGEAELDHAVRALRLLADRTRLAILALIGDQELSVGAIAEAVDRPPAAVSQHLAKLRAAGLVSTRREGTTIYYTQREPHLAGLVADAIALAEHALYAQPPHHRRARA